MPLPDPELITLDPNMIIVDRIVTSYVTFTSPDASPRPTMTIEYHGRINKTEERRVYTIAIDIDTAGRHAAALADAIARLHEDGTIL